MAHLQQRKSSTTFGIVRKGIEVKIDQYGIMQTDIPERDIINIAYRSSKGTKWYEYLVANTYETPLIDISILLSYLPDDLKVYPLDNSAQGVYSLGDLKKEIYGVHIEEFL